MKKKRFLLIGATSALVHALARHYALTAAQFYLLGRNHDKLMRVQQDLTVLGATDIVTDVVDLTCCQQHATVLDKAFAALKQVDVAVLGYGVLGEIADEEQDIHTALTHIHTNYTSYVSWLLQLRPRFAQQQHGAIVVIASVAGLRGRPSNYIYGSAKAGVIALCSGLRGRLHSAHVQVLTVLPGPMYTPMTAHLKPGRLWCRPEQAATTIAAALEHQTNGVLYVPHFWRGIMAGIQTLPESLFVRLFQ